jgi:DNA-directed RNA polymerase subunit RPC12/RpoP
VATSRKMSEADTCVNCAMCSREIPLHGAHRLRGEFSVSCPNCGQRKFYGSADVHDRKEARETNGASRAMHFGMKNVSIEPESRLEPKSWLRGCASWLLQ